MGQFSHQLSRAGSAHAETGQALAQLVGNGLSFRPDRWYTIDKSPHVAGKIRCPSLTSRFVMEPPPAFDRFPCLGKFLFARFGADSAFKQLGFARR